MKLLERVLNNRKRIQFVLFLVYVGFMLWMTLFNRTPYPHRVFRPELFWEIRSMLAGEESGKMVTLLFLENILFFVPFGFLYPGKKAFVTFALPACSRRWRLNSCSCLPCWENVSWMM